METGSAIPAGGASWQALQAICSPRTGIATASMPLGLPLVDAALPGGGLAAGGVHEWIGVERHAESGRGVVPLSILTYLGGQAAGHSGKRLVWIGEAVWPHPPTLRCLLARCAFVRAASPGERLWAVDLALRSGGVAGVIADGSRLDLSATRRLQLAAEAGGVPCFLARPPKERMELSAAATRWRVEVAPHIPGQPVPARRWIVELLRCKGVQPSAAAPRRWILERAHATGDGLVASQLFDRPGEEVTRRRQSG